MARKKKVVWQNHHIIYGKAKEELTVRIRRGEHWPISRLERYTKPLSKGCIIALEFLILKSRVRRLMKGR